MDIKVTDETEVVTKFPYDDLLNLGRVDLNNINRCLLVLLEISKSELFYENLKNVSTTVEFALSHLAVFDDMFQKEIFVHFLTLLSRIISKLASENKLNQILKNVDKIFEIMFYVSDLNIFCDFCVKISEPIFLETLKITKTVKESMEKPIVGILENFKRSSASNEFSIICDTILQRFPLDCNAFYLCSYWLMEDSLIILKSLNLKEESIESQNKIVILLRTIHTFYTKVVRNGISHAFKLEKVFREFFNELKTLTATFLHLCRYQITEKEAKTILIIIILEFLTQESNISYKIENQVREEVQNFDRDVRYWWRKFSHSFFFICHLLYANNRVFWPAGEIFQAMVRLIYTKKYKKTITICLLKSICYIYPLVYIYAPTPRRGLLGDDLLNIILPDYVGFLERIFTLTTAQLLWFLDRASDKFKKLIVTYWLKNSITEEGLDFLKKNMISSGSVNILIDVMVGCENSDVMKRTLELVNAIQTPSLVRSLYDIAPKFIHDQNIFPFLITALSRHDPPNKSTSLVLLKALGTLLISLEDEQTSITVCRFARSLMEGHKSEKCEVQFLCNDVVLIRVLISRAGRVGEDLVVEILRFLRKILKYQAMVIVNSNDTTPLKISIFLKKSKYVAEKALDLLCEIINHSGVIVIDHEDVLNILYSLFDLSEEASLSAKCHLCVTGLIKLYPALLDYPTMSTYIEDICFYSTRKKHSAVTLKLILIWIKFTASDRNRISLILPKEEILRNYFLRYNSLNKNLVNRNLYLISQIYSRDKAPRNTL
ncbi:uncharacterized protein LOC115888057 [Sitophilus oryzae]|uniref:Uncharacterized protein LOC115888057 n=1 Tax=Sitophilus oryzae TaxID=7048 RepID=A0A6J2YKT3_SITOR|nr:uncharacterized protein LOC115888057 [Sitophilus oryzae]